VNSQGFLRYYAMSLAGWNNVRPIILHSWFVKATDEQGLTWAVLKGESAGADEGQEAAGAGPAVQTERDRKRYEN
jgi:hypothetical protein